MRDQDQQTKPDGGASVSTARLGVDTNPCMVEAFWHGFSFGMLIGKEETYRLSADQIDSGATTRDLRIIANGLRVSIEKSRDDEQIGKCALSHAKPPNSDADLVCCESVDTPNA